MNEVMDTAKIEQLFGESARQLNEASTALGTLTARVTNLGVEHKKLADRENAHYQEFCDFREEQKENEYVSPAERQEIADAVQNRVTDILFSKGRMDIYGAFVRKAWSDAKRYGNVVGKGGVYTKRKHYKSAVEYIGTWIPYGYGIGGYIEHLDNKEWQ